MHLQASMCRRSLNTSACLPRRKARYHHTHTRTLTHVCAKLRQAHSHGRTYETQTLAHMHTYIHAYLLGVYLSRQHVRPHVGSKIHGEGYETEECYDEAWVVAAVLEAKSQQSELARVCMYVFMYTYAYTCVCARSTTRPPLRCRRHISRGHPTAPLLCTGS
jgi:hypothetical protein